MSKSTDKAVFTKRPHTLPAEVYSQSFIDGRKGTLLVPATHFYTFRPLLGIWIYPLPTPQASLGSYLAKNVGVRSFQWC